MLKVSIFAPSLIALCLAVVPAVAQNDLYDNGPTSGTVNAWDVNFSAVSDTFTLGSNSTVDGLTFALWLLPGDTLAQGVVSITSSEFGGTTYFDQTLDFVGRGCLINQFGFRVCDYTASFNPVSLRAGTYWLNLAHFSPFEFDDPVYWDENSGSSQASQNSLGTIPSESFTILGSATGTTGTSPEPSSIVLFCSGIVSLAGILRRRLF